MNPILVIGAIGLIYYLLQRNGTLGPLSGSPFDAPGNASAAQVAAAIQNNQIRAQQQTAMILGAQPSGPNMSFQLESAAITTGVTAAAGMEASALVAAGTVSSSVAGAATAGIGLLVGFGLMEWAAHTARVKGATAENTGIDQIIPAFDADLKEINAAYKAKQISASTAISYLSATRDNYWKYMAQFAGKPGVATRACPGGQVGGPVGHGGCMSGQPICDKGCTAGCCVGCSSINGAIANQIWAVQTGYHGPVSVCEVFGGKFGSHDRAGYQLYW